jgi:hypothetical protein
LQNTKSLRDAKSEISLKEANNMCILVQAPKKDNCEIWLLEISNVWRYLQNTRGVIEDIKLFETLSICKKGHWTAIALTSFKSLWEESRNSNVDGSHPNTTKNL